VTTVFVVLRDYMGDHHAHPEFESVWWNREEAREECLRLAEEEMTRSTGYILRFRVTDSVVRIEHKLTGSTWADRTLFFAKPVGIRGSAVMALASLVR